VSGFNVGGLEGLASGRRSVNLENVMNALMASPALLVSCAACRWTGFSHPVSLMQELFCQCRNSYLVDPASSHMLVSKIKPCMSKYKQICTVKLRMAH
jgi:hypothetical protein